MRPRSQYGPLADLLQHDVHRHRHGADRPLVQPVVGDVAKAQLLALRDLEFRERTAEETNVAGCERPLTCDGLGQLALAVPVHAGDAHDLTLQHLERDVVGTDLAQPRFDRHALELERRLGVAQRASTGATPPCR